VGAVILALAYVLVGLAFVAMALEQREWFTAAFAALIFTVAGWFIRMALRK
jgi:type IV secretory pathway TrbD component